MSKRKNPSKEQLKNVQDAVDFAQGLIKQKSLNAEGFLVTLHVVKEGRVFHTFSYEDFPTGDWGSVMIAIGVEAQKARLTAQSGAARME